MLIPLRWRFASTRARSFPRPYIFGDGIINPTDEPKDGMSLGEYAKMTEKPALTYDAHSSPLAFCFYTGPQFPEALHLRRRDH